MMNLTKSGLPPLGGSLKNGNPSGNPHGSPRCGAKAKSTGLPCRAPGVKKEAGRYGRCRVHGGKSRGPATPDGLAQSRRANWKTGYFSQVEKAKRREESAEVRKLVGELKAAVAELRKIA